LITGRSCCWSSCWMSNSGRVMAFTVETSGGAATELPNYLLQAQPNVIMNDNANWAEKRGELPAGTCRTGVSRQSRCLRLRTIGGTSTLLILILKPTLQRLETLRRWRIPGLR
jgi:hypothetical protein